MFKALFARVLIPLAFLCTVGAASTATEACHPPDKFGPAVAHVVDCGKEAITEQAISLIPAINSCLISVATLNPTPCLLALIDPARNIDEDTIACLVRSRGADYAAAARANPDDKLSEQAAEAARKFLDERRIGFSG